MKHQYHRPDLEQHDNHNSASHLVRDLKRILSPGDTILDIGANAGKFAVQVVGIESDVKIYSFEPLENAYAELIQLQRSYPQIVPMQYAISRESGQAEFFVTESDVGSSLLKPIPGQPSKWLALAKTIIVPTARLDEIIEVHALKLPIQLVKSDAQGADRDVLLSAGRYLNTEYIRAILVEVNFTDFYESQEPYYKLLELLDTSGYRVASIYPHRDYQEWLWWADILFLPR